MGTLKPGILLDNEQGAHDIESMCGVLCDFLSKDKVMQIMSSSIPDGGNPEEMFTDDYWDRCLDDILVALSEMAPQGHYVGWLPDHPGVIAVIPVEEDR